MKKRTLSIIIPNYNKENYIGKCLDSMLAQSLLPDEIIVVDDCSTDSSREIIKEYEEKSGGLVKGIFLEKNGGVSNARNAGLAAASSEYVTFTDSDDFYFSEDKLKNEMELIDRYAEQGEDIIAYSAIVRVDMQDNVLLYPNMMKPNFMRGNIFYDLMAYIRFENIPRDYCVKKELLITAGAYSYPRNYYEDFDLLFRLNKVASFIPTYQYGMAYRMTDNGLSKRSREDRDRELANIYGIHGAEMTWLDKARVVWKKITFFVWRAIRKLTR